MLEMVEAENVVSETELEVRHVRQSYPRSSGEPFVVLDDINLSLHAGEIVGLLGRSGCGKSTLLRIASGLVTPTAGEVRYHGRTLQGPAERIAMVFQTFALFPWLTVLAWAPQPQQNRHLAQCDFQDRSRLREVGLALLSQRVASRPFGAMASTCSPSVPAQRDRHDEQGRARKARSFVPANTPSQSSGGDGDQCKSRQCRYRRWNAYRPASPEMVL